MHGETIKLIRHVSHVANKVRWCCVLLTAKTRRRTASGISFTYDLSTLFNNLRYVWLSSRNTGHGKAVLRATRLFVGYFGDEYQLQDEGRPAHSTQCNVALNIPLSGNTLHR
jgi:hypothetical protein